jgi:hypothetical protein
MICEHIYLVFGVLFFYFCVLHRPRGDSKLPTTRCIREQQIHSELHLYSIVPPLQIHLQSVYVSSNHSYNVCSKRNLNQTLPVAACLCPSSTLLCSKHAAICTAPVVKSRNW